MNPMSFKNIHAIDTSGAEHGGNHSVEQIKGGKSIKQGTNTLDFGGDKTG